MSKSKTRQNKRRARVLIVDDHPAVREALAIRIAAQPDLQVCGEAADAHEALQIAADAEPDVAVVDIALKNSNGVDLIKRLKARNDKFRTIVWSMYSEGVPRTRTDPRTVQLSQISVNPQRQTSCRFGRWGEKKSQSIFRRSRLSRILGCWPFANSIAIWAF